MALKFLLIPLLFLFPKSENKGVINTPSQRIDIAPTLLDYMGITPPEWMEGNSLLKPIPPRYLITTRRATSTGKKFARHVESPKAPYYTLGELAISSCDMQYVLKLRENNRILKLPILNFLGDCKALNLNETIAKEQMKLHLEQRNWDTSLLATDLID